MDSLENVKPPYLWTSRHAPRLGKCDFELTQVWSCHQTVFSLLLSCFCLINIGGADDKPLKEPAFTLVPQRPFLKLPKGDAFGACSAVAVNSKGEIYVFHRGPRPIQCFDADGTFLRAWGDDLIKTAHGLRVDRDDNVWVTDVGGNRVFKFDPSGRILVQLGTGVAGPGLDQFNEPTDIAFGPMDEVYVSDGYGNSRVMKFDQQGKFVLTWGFPGTEKGQFRLPHSIIVDREGRVLVGDRENNRIQIFDDKGKWLASWKGYAPYGMSLDADGRLFVADGRACQVLLLDDRGKVRKRWGKEGEGPGQFQMPHMLTFDGDGNLYVAEVDGKRLQKLARKMISKP
jgi:DNA-binding beta-propeller fold protein YncE